MSGARPSGRSAKTASPCGSGTNGTTPRACGSVPIGNELWELDSAGLMCRREASVNDVVMGESDRRLFGPRADGDNAGIPIR
jgi:hypothetical protein